MLCFFYFFLDSTLKMSWQLVCFCESLMNGNMNPHTLPLCWIELTSLCLAKYSSSLSTFPCHRDLIVFKVFRSPSWLCSLLPTLLTVSVKGASPTKQFVTHCVSDVFMKKRDSCFLILFWKHFSWIQVITNHNKLKKNNWIESQNDMCLYIKKVN